MDQLQTIQIIQELLVIWDKLQQRLLAGLPIASAIPTTSELTGKPILLPAALQAFANTLFPLLDPALRLDAAVSVLSAGFTYGVQRLLNMLSANLVLDGYWGVTTTQTVKAFQAIKGLPQHGWVDEQTYLALISEANRPPAERIKVKVP